MAMLPLLDAQALRAQFPGLGGLAHGKPFVYLDSAATAQNLGTDRARLQVE